LILGRIRRFQLRARLESPIERSPVPPHQTVLEVFPHTAFRSSSPQDLRQLSALCGFTEVADFQRAHRDWVDEAIKREMVARESRWSEAVAVGSLSFVNTVKSELGFKAAHREVISRFER
jgi:hypothetical protein